MLFLPEIGHDWIHLFLLSPTEFDLASSDSNFTTLFKVFANHILAENMYLTHQIEWTEGGIMVLNSANKYQIICQCHYFSNFLSICKYHLLWSWKLQIVKIRQFFIQIYYLNYSGFRQIFPKIMQYLFFNKISRYTKIHPL